MKWKFDQLTNLQNYAFDEVLERFFKFGIEGLIRENIQNSLDAHQENDQPVRIAIRLGELKRSDIPGLDELEEHIQSLKGYNDYTRNTIQHMKDILSKKALSIPYLSMEDANTKGLKGSGEGYSRNNPNQYQAYAYSRGMHFNDNEDKKVIKGGSFGVGKIASNAASDIYTMFFANHDATGHATLGGSIHLIEHRYQGQGYRAHGFFTDIQEDLYKPYENAGFSEVFQKETQGLKIIIPFLRDGFANKYKIVRAVIDSFLLAIYRGELEVEVEDKSINQGNLLSYLNDDAYYAFDDLDTMIREDEVYTPLYYQTLDEHYFKEISVFDKLGSEYRFDLYFQYDELIPKGVTGIFRNIGMKIEDFKVKSNVMKPYNAMLIPKGKHEDKFLKLLENESHTELSYESIKDKSASDNARYFINQIHKVMSQTISDFIDAQTPSEGILHTNDILYEINNEFKKQMQKTTSTLRTGKEGPNPKKTPTTKTTEPSKEGRKVNGKNKRPEYLSPVKRKFGADEMKTYYQANTTAIKRTRFSGSERIQISLGEAEYLKEIDHAHLNITMVDGNGKESFDQIDLKTLYNEVLDIHGDNALLDFEDHRIKDVSIKNKKIELVLKKSDQLNNYKLKFYLEV